MSYIFNIFLYLIALGRVTATLLVFGGVGIFAFERVFRRRTKAYAFQAREWLAFKKILKNFSQFKNEIPQAVIIWEERLVYGTALGVAKKVSLIWYYHLTLLSVQVPEVQIKSSLFH